MLDSPYLDDDDAPLTLGQQIVGLLAGLALAAIIVISGFAVWAAGTRLIGLWA
jgi:hypothetical protein